MKGIGVLILIVGVLFGLYALSMDVSVSTDFGSVNNVGLMNDRQNYLMVAGVAVIAGIILLALGNRDSHQVFSSDPFEAQDQAKEIERKRYAVSLGITRENGVYHFAGEPFADLEEAITTAETNARDITAARMEETREQRERGNKQDRVIYVIVMGLIGVLCLWLLFR